MFHRSIHIRAIVALRNEKGSYNWIFGFGISSPIVAQRNEKGSYNESIKWLKYVFIVALRNEKGSYNSITADF